MKIYCRGTAYVRRKGTNESHEIRCDELDWDAVGGDERQMGPEIHYRATVEHPDLGTLTWSLWEYPLGIENYRESNVGEHQLIEDFAYGLEHEPEPDDDWNAYSLPDNPFDIFLASMRQTSELLARYGSYGGADLLNRMVFSHQITALEAYLSDTLLNEVLRDNDALSRLIQNDSDLRQMKFTLAEIAIEPDLIRTEVRKHLRSILYHNLAKVDALYGIALNARILPLIEDRKRDLFEAVLLRHDCVHRNGFDKDGKQLTVFTKQFIQDQASLIKDFVEKVERALRARSTDQQANKV